MSNSTPNNALVTRINKEHGLCEGAARSAVKHAVEAGRLLINAKSKCSHGGWTEWVQTNCAFSDQTARVYMRLARELPKRQRAADLSLRDAVKMITRPNSAPTTIEAMFKWLCGWFAGG